ncbi:alpha/beta hydrolase family protein [Aquiflexum lacus]|uniref:alpha/beta hydrolase family protein n=1 Tax=Aquiflexum lacus TaxID=2483805 RepID=UPI001893F3DD|nr:alpha/beta hydrolase [Aquiflexum lacus]
MEDLNEIKRESFQAICSDGVVLKGILMIPEKAKAVVQFNGGTAAKKEFYLPFLEFLATEGFICCLWDYRGSGDSAPDNLKNCNFTFSDYGLKDMPTIKDYLNSRFPQFPYLIFGHSVGGQQIGFMDNLSNVKGMVNFAVSTGYQPNMPFSYRLLFFYFFYIFTPLSILLTGYLSAKQFGIMEDLPKNVVLEWRNWCSKKDYFFDPAFYGKSVPEGNFKKFDFPIHTFWATDDTISNEKNTKSYWKHVESKKPITFYEINPSELGEKEVGHFGFFKKRLKEKLWGKALAKLEEFI